GNGNATSPCHETETRIDTAHGKTAQHLKPRPSSGCAMLRVFQPRQAVCSITVHLGAADAGPASSMTIVAARTAMIVVACDWPATRNFKMAAKIIENLSRCGGVACHWGRRRTCVLALRGIRRPHPPDRQPGHPSALNGGI